MNGQEQRDDAALVAAARAGDMAAFEALLARYERRLFAFLRQMTGHTAGAEDLAQTVWIAVHRNLHRFDTARSFPTWLFTIARNAAISAWRSRKDEALELREHDWVDHAHPGASTFAREDAESIWAFVADHLGAEQRDALWLMYREEMSVRDIARTLNCSTVRVKVMLHRARKKLLKAFSGQPAAGVAGMVGAT